MVLNSAGDTTICISISQSKFLLKKYYEAEKFSNLDSICEHQLALSDSLYNSQKIVIANQSLIIRNDGEIINLKDEEIKTAKESLDKQKKRTRVQKFEKQISIALGTIATLFMTYLWVTK
jgi:hypothetical protein